MKRSKIALFLSLAILIIGVSILSFTYFYSSLVVYKMQDEFSLAEASAQGFSIHVREYDTISIEGTSSNPVDIYIIGLEPQQVASGVNSFHIIYTSPISGNLYIQFRTLPYTNLTSISFTIEVFNSWFSGIGYTSSILFIIIGLIVMGYYLQIRSGKGRR
ncbi:hypothetical protein V6M85_06290 [Sulfolobus tengchongensis]|uniref:Uncharacterized protein n=1 Tax=Sulfolobus tengchongensis TaxID=207809 RepID=A0AAX4L397_9CREN